MATGDSTVTKNVVVKVTVEGDVNALNAIARLENAIARQMAETRRATKASKDFANQTDDLNQSSSKSAQTMVQYGQQVQDFAVQVQGGQSVLNAFTQQFSQLAFVASQSEGAMKKFGLFMAGPWGTAIFGAVVVLQLLVTAFSETEEEADKTIDTLNISIASFEELATAISTLNKELDQNLTSTRQIAQAQLEASQATLVRTKAELELLKTQRAQRIEAQQAALASGEEGAAAGTSLGVIFNAQDIKQAETLINSTEAAIRKLQFTIGKENIAASFDKAAAATLKYNDAVDKLNKSVQEGQITSDQGLAQFRKLTEAHNKEIDAIKESNKQRKERKEKLTDEEKEAKKLAEAIEEAIKQYQGFNPEVQALIDKNIVLEGAYKQLTGAIYDHEHAINDVTTAAGRLGQAIEDNDEKIKKARESTEQLTIALTSLGNVQNSTKKFQDASELATQYERGGAAGPEGARILDQMDQIREAIKILEAFGLSTEKAESDLAELQARLEELSQSGVARKGIELLTGSIDAFTNAINSAITRTQTWGEAFEQAGRQIVAALVEIALKLLVLKLLGGTQLGASLSKSWGFGQGGAIEGGVKKFQSGGVLTGPTYFPMASGMGLAGEAGPEAIMPLQRDSSGRLGVASPPVNVNIINNAGADVSVNENSDGSIDVIVARAVQASRTAIASDFKRGGTEVSRSLERVYGVNRAQGAY